VQTLGKRSANAQLLLEALYIKPTVSSSSLATQLGISQPTADRMISEFQKLGILHELTGRRRNRVFYFKEYYQLFTS
jgi:Fic family protein